MADFMLTEEVYSQSYLEIFNSTNTRATNHNPFCTSEELCNRMRVIINADTPHNSQLLVEFEKYRSQLKIPTFVPIFWGIRQFRETELPKEDLMCFSPEVQEIKKTDYLTLSFFEALETKLLEIKTQISELQDPQIYFYEEKDIEIPQWHKIKLSLKINETDFDRKLQILRIVDAAIKGTTEKLKKSFSTKEQRNRLNSFYKNLYIKLEEI